MVDSNLTPNQYKNCAKTPNIVAAQGIDFKNIDIANLNFQ